MRTVFIIATMKQFFKNFIKETKEQYKVYLFFLLMFAIIFGTCILIYFANEKARVKNIKVIENPLPPVSYHYQDNNINNYQDLKRILIRENIPFPELFTKVAILESGWRFEGAFKHNIFGWTHYEAPKGLGILIGCEYGLFTFLRKYDAVRYLKYWVSLNPPVVGENGINYLRRRYYNPYAGYYETLNKIII